MRIILPNVLNETYLENIFSILSSHKGSCEVFLDFCLEDKINLKVQSLPMRIQGATALEEKLNQIGCQVEWIG